MFPREFLWYGLVALVAALYLFLPTAYGVSWWRERRRERAGALRRAAEDDCLRRLLGDVGAPMLGWESAAESGSEDEEERCLRRLSASPPN
jgi:hypothetical protein